MTLTNPFADADGKVNTDRLDRYVNGFQKLTPFLLIGTIVIAILVLWAVKERNDNDDAAVCRSIYANEVTSAQAVLNGKIGLGLYALSKRDDVLLNDTASGVPSALRRLNEAIDRQRSELRIAKVDQARFLTRCRPLR